MSDQCRYCHMPLTVGRYCQSSECPNCASDQDEWEQDAREYHEEMLDELQHEQFIAMGY